MPLYIAYLRLPTHDSSLRFQSKGKSLVHHRLKIGRGSNESSTETPLLGSGRHPIEACEEDRNREEREKKGMKEREKLSRRRKKKKDDLPRVSRARTFTQSRLPVVRRSGALGRDPRQFGGSARLGSANDALTSVYYGASRGTDTRVFGKRERVVVARIAAAWRRRYNSNNFSQTRSFSLSLSRREKIVSSVERISDMRPAVTSHCSRRLTFGATASRDDSPQLYRSSERAIPAWIYLRIVERIDEERDRRLCVAPNRGYFYSEYLSRIAFNRFALSADWSISTRTFRMGCPV